MSFDLDAAMKQLESHDLQLNNFFQLQDGSWRVNVRRGEKFFDFGTGKTPEAAFQDAIAEAGTAPKQPKLHSVFD